MAEGLGKKLEAVLQKLEKLDVIENRLDQVYKTLASIEEAVSRLDSEVEELKTKSKKLNKSVKESEESVKLNDEDISDLKGDSKKLQHDVYELQKQLLYMETYSRRENVKIVGLPKALANASVGEETQDDAQAQIENTREIVYDFLEDQLKITNAREKIEFQRIHPLGKPKSGSSRPIIARFLRYNGNKQLVMDQARKHLKDTNLHV